MTEQPRQIDITLELTITCAKPRKPPPSWTELTEPASLVVLGVALVMMMICVVFPVVAGVAFLLVLLIGPLAFLANILG